MIHLDVKRAMDDPDHPGLRIAGTFIGLEKYADLLVRYLPHVKDQERLRFMARLRRQMGTHGQPDDGELKEIEWLTKELVPQYFIGAYAVALWAAVEQSSAEIAEYVREKESLRLKFSELRHSSAWDKLVVFLETAWKKRIRFAKETVDCFDYLHVIRNSIAHANGNLARDRDTDRRKKLEKLVKAKMGVGLRNDQIILTHRFVGDSRAIVESALDSVIAQVGERYPLK